MSIEHQFIVWLLLTNLASFATGASVGIFIVMLNIRKMRGTPHASIKATR